MSTASLPDRPDLDQLRRQAKELRTTARAGDPAALDRLARHVPSGDPGRLATAQLAIAREHGFSSWPALRAEVMARTAGLAEQVQAFLYESVAGHGDRAVRLLRQNPSIATYDFRTAVVLGEVTAVHDLLAGDPGLATRADRTTGWPPLLGACMSRWPSLDPQRSAGIRDAARLLLDAGAHPNTTVGSRPGRPDYCSTLFGAAGCRGNSELTELLLDRGATADAHTVYLAAFHPDRRALELLLEHGAPVDDTALAAPLTTGDAEVARLLIDAGADASRMIPPEALGEGDPGELPLVVAVRNGHSAELVELLLEGGADPNAAGRDGRSLHRLAVRQGRTDLAAALRHGGARAEATDETKADLFLAACLQGDRAAAEEALHRGWVQIDGLTNEDRATILHAADHGRLAAVELMLELGFPIDTRGDDGATPLHMAAAAGSVDVTRLLIDRGADVHARDTTFGSTPVVWASVGSGMRLGRSPNPDWVATIQLLVDAGASAHDAWLAGAKAPSLEVAELLRAHGVTEPHNA